MVSRFQLLISKYENIRYNFAYLSQTLSNNQPDATSTPLEELAQKYQVQIFNLGQYLNQKEKDTS
ncbi:unnamed protein product [Paramecium sonneborni]|uniref:Uncharacterized protein n=1 Tax=Paramecium sonneborni TaxID=65129 RepID=A0A8S1PPT5_9CILI|nr:unnamed protein product [Paramecium sonneborni]